MHAMTVDVKYQVPAVAVHTHVFAPVTRSVARVNGTPGLRQVFVPQPVMGKTPQELRAYIDGNDPITGRPVMREIVEGLTGALTEEDLKGLSFKRSTPRLCVPDSEEHLQRLFLENDWTDKLPVVLPTEERVAEMLRHTSHRPDEVVGHMRPTHFREYWEYTVEKVAVNAVMAGARPEYFPAVLALAASGVTARGSTSSSGAVMAVVNGPVRGELGMNSGIGAMGPFNHANATIGRAYGLLSQNLQGGAVPGHTYMGSQGNGYGYGNLTFAENEERSPWEPLHVQRGFSPGDSVVSVFTGCQATAYVLGIRKDHWRDHVRNLLRGGDPNSPPALILDPITARQFIDIGGLETKQALIDWVHDNAVMPAGEYWDYQLVQNYKYPRATFGEEPWASMLKAPPDELIPMYRREDINVVVVGGETNAYWRIIGCTLAKSVRIDDWR
ncbi:MAG: hypothetical protein KGJ86_07915 [Chloroflexota bacterium]|nr:hypothetical protein [Chloroflexota bacterium]